MERHSEGDVSRLNFDQRDQKSIKAIEELVKAIKVEQFGIDIWVRGSHKSPHITKMQQHHEK